MVDVRHASSPVAASSPTMWQVSSWYTPQPVSPATIRPSATIEPLVNWNVAPCATSVSHASAPVRASMATTCPSDVFR